MKGEKKREGKEKETGAGTDEGGEGKGKKQEPPAPQRSDVTLNPLLLEQLAQLVQMTYPSGFAPAGRSQRRSVGLLAGIDDLRRSPAAGPSPGPRSPCAVKTVVMDTGVSSGGSW
jgi:hypothetical protein